MNYYQTARMLFGLADVFITSPVRIIGQKTGISKSSIHRFRTAFKRRQKFPESQIWETEEGMKWLIRLVIASIYQLGLKGGVGSPTLKGFFDLIHITTHLGLSESSIERIRDKIIEEINYFGSEQIDQCKNSDEVVELILGADETWLENMTLVLMDLSSGFIFLEKSAKKRDFKTWCDMASDALSGFSCKVLCLVSDRAIALIKLANDHLQCPSIADLFHILNDINKEFALSIHYRLEDAKKKLVKAELLLNHPNRRGLSEIQKTVEIQKEKLDKNIAAKSSWLQTMKDCSLCVHPFDPNESLPQTTKETVFKFETIIQSFENVINTNEIPDRKNTFSKVRKQINNVCQSIELVERNREFF